MDPAAPTGGPRRGWRRRMKWLTALAALPLAAFALSNLWLTSHWGRGMITQRVERRVGVETTLTAATWSPWNGLTLHGFVLQQPTELRQTVKKPLLSIARIRIAPVWKAWLRGRIAIHEVELATPELVLPIELIAHLATAQAPPPPVAAPAQQTPTPAPPPAPPPEPTSPPQPPVPSPPPPPQPARPTSWVRLKNASFEIVGLGQPEPLFTVGKLNANLPIGGDPAKGDIHFADCRVIDGPTLPELRVPISWKAPVLATSRIDTRALGLNLQIAAQLALSSGLPILINGLIPEQEFPETHLLMGVKAASKTLTAQARFGGLLLAPGSWQGDLVARSRETKIGSSDVGTTFSHGNLITILRGGTVQCVDARLIGEDLSFLGNAAVLSDGRAAAALRVVAPPSALRTISQRFFPRITTPPPLTALSTDQRAALDTTAFGTIQNLTLEIGRNGPRLTLAQAFASAAP